MFLHCGALGLLRHVDFLQIGFVLGQSRLASLLLSSAVGRSRAAHLLLCAVGLPPRPPDLLALLELLLSVVQSEPVETHIELAVARL